MLGGVEPPAPTQLELNWYTLAELLELTISTKVELVTIFVYQNNLSI